MDWAGKLSLLVHFDNERGGGCLPTTVYRPAPRGVPAARRVMWWCVAALGIVLVVFPLLPARPRAPWRRQPGRAGGRLKPVDDTPPGVAGGPPPASAATGTSSRCCCEPPWSTGRRSVAAAAVRVAGGAVGPDGQCGAGSCDVDGNATVLVPKAVVSSAFVAATVPGHHARYQTAGDCRLHGAAVAAFDRDRADARSGPAVDERQRVTRGVPRVTAVEFDLTRRNADRRRRGGTGRHRGS